VTPQHLVLTDAELQTFDANCKVDPPLRSREHVEALVAGLCDGTIEVICSDHCPVPAELKDRELDLAPFGIVGLETLLPLCVRALIDSERMDWPGLLGLLSTGPARILGLQKGTLQEGAAADVILIDPAAKWTIDSKTMRAGCTNSPFIGWQVRGRVESVFVDGELRFQAEASS
jgi:dihydroorotase